MRGPARRAVLPLLGGPIGLVEPLRGDSVPRPQSDLAKLIVRDHLFEERKNLSLFEPDVCFESLGKSKGRSPVNPAFMNLERKSSDQCVYLKVFRNDS